MRKLRRVLNLLPLFILWAMLSMLVWGFVFTHITDTDRARKLTFCVDAPVPGDTEIALEMEKGTGEGIRMVKVHPFTYAMMDASTLEGADLFLIPEDHLEMYRDWLLPLPDRLRAAGKNGMLDGVPLGVLARDGVSGKGICPEWVQYQESLDYYLCLGAKSLHVQGLDGAADDEAAAAFLRLLDGLWQ